MHRFTYNKSMPGVNESVYMMARVFYSSRMYVEDYCCKNRNILWISIRLFFFSGQKSQKKIGTLLKKQAQFSPWKSGPFLIIYCEIPWNTVDRFLSITVKYCEILYGILVNSYHLLCMHSGGKWSFTVIHKNSQVSTPKK